MTRTALLAGLAGAAILVAGAASAQTVYGDVQVYGGGYGPAYGDYGYSGGYGAYGGQSSYGSSYGSGYGSGHAAPAARRAHGSAYSRAPAPAYPADPTWGYGYGYGGVGHVQAYGATGYGAPYGQGRPYYADHGYYGHGYDRGGRYGYSQGRYRTDQRSRGGYRDYYGYNDDRPPSRWGRSHDQGHGYRRDCDCHDVYIYDR